MKKPFAEPLGLGKASESDKRKWESDNFVTRVYHYEDGVLLWLDDNLASSELHEMQFAEGGPLPSAN
jgi:hypothetical protein